MTFCLGMTVREGIVGIADSRVTSGNEIIQAKKVNVYRQDGGSFFVMTSGLRSLRDKAVTYFDDVIALQEQRTTASSRSRIFSRSKSGESRPKTGSPWPRVDSSSICSPSSGGRCCATPATFST
jgi:hypothetical protein